MFAVPVLGGRGRLICRNPLCHRHSTAIVTNLSWRAASCSYPKPLRSGLGEPARRRSRVSFWVLAIWSPRFRFNPIREGTPRVRRTSDHRFYCPCPLSSSASHNATPQNHSWRVEHYLLPAAMKPQSAIPSHPYPPPAIKPTALSRQSLETHFVHIDYRDACLSAPRGMLSRSYGVQEHN